MGALGATTLLDRGKRSIALDLKDDDDLRVVRALVRRADVLLEGFRPGVMERLGLGPDELLAENPALVYGRMTGWGQTGPLAVQRGPRHRLHRADRGARRERPTRRAPGAADEPARRLRRRGMFLALGAVAALLHARTTGQGQVVDAAIVDGTAVLTTMIHGMLDAGVWRDRRGVNLLDTGAPFYDVYRCADGQFVAVGALEEQFYAALLDGLGLAGDETLPDRSDPRQWPALRERFTEVVRGRTRDEWWTVFSGTDACVAPVWSLLEATRDTHNAERGVFVEVDGAPAARRRPPVLGHPRRRSAGCPRPASTATRSAPSSVSCEARPRSARCGTPQRRRVSGNSRSTNRSTTGCGSWLASPGRSLASMKT